MPTRVTRDQFEMRESVLVHRPTGAEFTPHPEREDSIIVWTGDIGTRLPNGELYDYGEVLAMMRTVWRETFLTRSRLELTEV
ncbi:MAG TPA: hypothetical protein VNJ31_09160 [Methyloceanibacter sp.]|nr:hypothetical protein [Methyloceanibacter sp.]